MQADPPNTNAVLAVAGISGISAHIFLYRHGEWDLTAPKIFIFYLTLLLGAVIVDHLELTGLENTTQRHLAVRSVGCHILAIYSSMLIYRALFHRLCKFPGPFLARLSNFYVAGLSAKKAQLYKETQRLHKLYGDYVRIGPTVLSITDPTAVKEIYSSKAKVSKGPFYTVSEPRVSLQTSRNKEEHARRRRVWDQAFSSKALRNYEPRVIHYTNQLINAIGKGLGKPMNVSKWFNYYSFDVMGDLSFGKSFNMLVDGKDSYILSQLHGDMAKVGIFIHLTWLFPFFKRTPGLNKEYLKFWRFVEGSVVERIQVSKNPPDRPDVFSWILDAYNKAPKTKQNWLDVIGDAYLIIVAGSDTTAATLTFLFYHLASDKFLYKKLQAELDTLSELSYDKLRNVGLLNAVINETLRLHPAVPSGTQRQTPKEGIFIGDRYIPGDVMVWMPSHSLFRDERVFSRPQEFIPERWTSQPELIKDSTVFIPFNGGPYACVGKQLALMELYCVTAGILTKYDVSFAEGQTKSAFLDGKIDAFTVVAAPLELVFKERE